MIFRHAAEAQHSVSKREVRHSRSTSSSRRHSARSRSHSPTAARRHDGSKEKMPPTSLLRRVLTRNMRDVEVRGRLHKPFIFSDGKKVTKMAEFH